MSKQEKRVMEKYQYNYILQIYNFNSYLQVILQA